MKECLFSLVTESIQRLTPEKTIHKNVQMHIKWEWILECNLFCDRISLLKKRADARKWGVQQWRLKETLTYNS